MQPDWVDNIHHWCTVYEVPFFFKQWGNFGADGIRRSKKANGREYKGKHWNGYPHHHQSLECISAIPLQQTEITSQQRDLFSVIRRP